MAENKDDIDIKKQVSTKKKSSKLDRIINFLTDKEDEEKNQVSGSKKVKFPGFFDFIIRNWQNKKKQAKDELLKDEIPTSTSSESPKKGLIKGFTTAYADYQKAKEKETENLHIYETISQEAKFSKEFIALLTGSCLIATFGLFDGSEAAIIGAMLIAPLMMPIFGFSLGVIWGDNNLLKHSIFMLSFGSMFVLTIAFILALIIPGVDFNNQINARTNPTLYDIIIALVSGLVGAYACVNPMILPNISGVAIAVALMPPLCVVGISLGLGDFKAASGAAILYLTNLVSIALAASIVFWRMKIHPADEPNTQIKNRKKKNLTLSTVILILISLPLFFFMRETYLIKHYYADVKDILNGHISDISIIDLSIKKYPETYEIKSLVVIAKEMEAKEILDINTEITKLFDEKVKIDISYIRRSAKGKNY